MSIRKNTFRFFVALAMSMQLICLGEAAEERANLGEFPKATFFFRLTDEKGKVSHLLLTQHDKPANLLHKIVHQTFEQKTSRVVGELKEESGEELYGLLKELNAFYGPADQPLVDRLPEKYYHIEGADQETLQLLQKVKPWAVLALHLECVGEDVQAGGMDNFFYDQAKAKKKYTVGWLETSLTRAKAWGLPDYTREQILADLKKIHGEFEIPPAPAGIDMQHELAEIFSDSDNGFMNGDLARVEQESYKCEKWSLSFHTIQASAPRNDVMLPEILRHHRQNNGNVFFMIGVDHGIGPRGLLIQLRDHFKIEQLSIKGEYLPFVYKPLQPAQPARVLPALRPKAKLAPPPKAVPAQPVRALPAQAPKAKLAPPPKAVPAQPVRALPVQAPKAKPMSKHEGS